MLLVARPMMTRRKIGRPKAEEGDAGTGLVRVFEDIRDMLSDITLVKPDMKTAQILDPLIRPEVTRIWEKFKAQIEDAKNAARIAGEALERARQDAARVADERVVVKKPKPGS